MRSGMLDYKGIIVWSYNELVEFFKSFSTENFEFKKAYMNICGRLDIVYEIDKYTLDNLNLNTIHLNWIKSSIREMLNNFNEKHSEVYKKEYIKSYNNGLKCTYSLSVSIAYAMISEYLNKRYNVNGTLNVLYVEFKRDEDDVKLDIVFDIN